MNFILSIPLIDIIIPLYYCDPKLYLIIDKFFKSLNKYYPQLNQIIIDDASPLEHNFPVTYRNKKNMGFTHSVNKGLSLSKAPIIIITNDDLEFQKGELDNFFLIGKDRGIYFPADTASGNLNSFGAIWGMNRETYNILGKLDEKYKHFYSDKDYLERAIKKNIPIINWPDIRIIHHESATFNTLDKEKLLNNDKEKYIQRIIL